MSALAVTLGADVTALKRALARGPAELPTPFSPPTGPATGSFNGPHRESNFLGASLSPERRGWRS